MHNFIEQSLNSGSVQVQISVLGLPEVCDSKNKISHLSSVNHSAKQFIVNIIIIKI